VLSNFISNLILNKIQQVLEMIDAGFNTGQAGDVGFTIDDCRFEIFEKKNGLRCKGLNIFGFRIKCGMTERNAE